MTSKLTLAYSTCPNDTFIFHALKERLINCGDLEFNIKLADVEELNQKAEKNIYDISKLSFATIGHLQDNYGLLKTGAALGRGCGPLIVARKDCINKDLLSCKIAIPGIRTTANMLLGLYLSENSNLQNRIKHPTLSNDISHIEHHAVHQTTPSIIPQTIPMTFDKIMPALQNNECQFGAIIHEGRFTYKNYDLVCIADLGNWWEKKTSLPIPLGGIAIKRDLPVDIIRKVESIIGESVKYGFKHKTASADYIKQYASEMDDSVINEHINLYVNDFSVNLGTEGKKAVEKLFSEAKKHHLIPSKNNMSIFA